MKVRDLIPWRAKEKEKGGALAVLPFERLRYDMDRVFERFVTDMWDVRSEPFAAFADWNGDKWAPALDVTETDNEVTVRAELPGVKPEDLDISVSGDVLTLSGEKKETTQKKEKGYEQTECHYGSFRRSVTLPGHVDPEKVSATYADGVLEIRLEKVPGSMTRHILVAAT